MRKQRTYYVYILANTWNTVLYTGMTKNLARRIYEHKHGISRGFSFRYNLNKLVYFEATDSPSAAIAREKQIKAGSRKKKIVMIERMNPDWRDLGDDL